MEVSQISELFTTVKSNVIGEYKVNFIRNFDQFNTYSDNKIYIVDNRLLNLYKIELKNFLNPSRLISIEAKEESKTLNYIYPIIKELLHLGVRKDSTLVAVGGGVTQDIVAFISSILFRGIKWEFYPTTLLAQCDSCIGSKSSINFEGYKNLLGTFLPPTEIFIYPNFLNTLDEKDIKSGIGEMSHYFLGKKQSKIFELFENYEKILKDRSLLIKYIKSSLSIKKEIIEIDEFDENKRHIFNYGHTFGHALEFVTNYKITHGQAVTIGINIANYVSLKKNLIDIIKFNEILELTKINFPSYDFKSFEIKDYMSALSKDKKNKGNYLGCILIDQEHKLEKYFIDINDDFKTLIKEFFNHYV